MSAEQPAKGKLAGVAKKAADKTKTADAKGSHAASTSAADEEVVEVIIDHLTD